MVTRGPQRGYTLLEVTIAMAIFGLFLSILAVLTVEMRGYEERLPVNFMRHPQVNAVVARLRRDVLDAHGSNPYRNAFQGYTMSEKTLILESVQPNGSVQTIVWDFTTPGVVRRRSWNVGVPSDWVARGLPPDFSSGIVIDAVSIPGRPWGVRIIAKDKGGQTAIDQLLQPRAHE